CRGRRRCHPPHLGRPPDPHRRDRRPRGAPRLTEAPSARAVSHRRERSRIEKPDVRDGAYSGPDRGHDLGSAAERRGETMAKRTEGREVKLLSGGNPQIPKGDGDEPVQAYIAAMPG